MKRVYVLTAVVLGMLLLPKVAHATDDIDQHNEIMFGIMGAYVPTQNDLPADVVAVGHYVSFSHSVSFFYTGFRLGIAYAWLPNGAPGQQWMVEPDLFVGLKWRVVKPVALRLEVGSGGLFNGGEGISFAIVNHTYVRGAIDVTVVKSVIVEAFGGPSLILGSAVGGFAEFGLGAGWSF